MTTTRAPLRVLIVAAHPDDELISAGVLLRRMCHAGAVVHVMHLTDGSPRNTRAARAHGFETREQYAEVRRRELAAALRCAGIRPAGTIALGFLDQEVAFHLVDLSHRVADWLRRHAVDVVLCHPYEGGHPDHDAAAFGVHAACRLLGEAPAPNVIEFTSYHAHDGHIRTGAFLEQSGPAGYQIVLSPEESAVKRRACACFESQSQILAHFRFDAERFRGAPAYRFDERAHPGRLFYEHYDWGLDAERWCEVASQALRLLKLCGEPL
jgi:N-acetylglucosamine malate deacetylase 2